MTRPAATAEAAPLVAMEAVALDTETTGLDVRADRIVQIGAVRLVGAELRDTERFETLVNPGIPIPEAASRIHRVRDGDVADAPGTAEALRRLADWIGAAPVIGHSVHFDLAILRHEALRAGVAWREPRALDTGLLAAGLNPALVETSLDGLALALGVEITERHTALGDAIAAARVYGAMQPQLLAAGVRTLAEAEALCRRPRALVDRQEQAGWFDRPDARPDFSEAAIRLGAARAIDAFLYRHRLADVMGAPPHTVTASETLAEAAARMTRLGIGCLIVEPLAAAEAGIVTERDILRAMGTQGAGAALLTVGAVMSRPVIAAPHDMLLYRALGLMARRNLRYIGVSGADGAICGVFTLRTLLRERGLATLTVGDEIATARDAADLARAQGALPRLAASLLADGMAAREIAQVIAAEGRAMTARAAELAAAEMAAEGRGGPPAGCCLLVLGSGGRGESLLAPDQDNALVIADGYPGDLDAPDDWFAVWAEKLTGILDRAGVPLCKGGVMARNRAWRRRLSEWRAEIGRWAAHPDPQALLNVDIFYDFAPVHAVGPGGETLAEALRQAAVEAAAGALGLVRALGEAAGEKRPPVGFLGRIRTDDQGRVDLKAGGLLPIVSGARAMALRRGVAALSTPERLTQAAARAGLALTDMRLLADVQGFLMLLVLRQQIRDIEAGRPPSNRVELRALERDERDRLKEAFGRIELIRDTVRTVLAA